MRLVTFFSVLALIAAVPVMAQQAAPAASGNYTLTVVVDGVNQLGGNVGLLLFNSSKGWAEDRSAALKDITVPAHPGIVTDRSPGTGCGRVCSRAGA